MGVFSHSTKVKTSATGPLEAIATNLEVHIVERCAPRLYKVNNTRSVVAAATMLGPQTGMLLSPIEASINGIRASGDSDCDTGAMGHGAACL